MMQPSQWVVENIPYIRRTGHVLDLACGSGRHTRLLLTRGFRVTAVDIDVSGIEDLSTNPDCRIVQADLESGHKWPLSASFDAIIVTHYLHRPLFPHLVASLSKGGILIYHTFMVGNEVFHKPSNPKFLLRDNELKDVFGEDLTVLKFWQGQVESPKTAVIQQLCARKV